MELKAIHAGAAATLFILCGCAAIGRERSVVERFEERRISAPALTVESGSVLRFVNSDTRPHQVYSNDCSELSSTLLQPGETYQCRCVGFATRSPQARRPVTARGSTSPHNATSVHSKWQ